MELERTEKRKDGTDIFLLVMAAINLIYGIAVRAIHTTHISFIIWIMISLFFIILYLIRRYGIWKRMSKAVRMIILVILISCLVLFTLAEGFVLSGFDPTPEKDLDYIVVLGAKIYGDEPSPSLKYRLDAAAGYLEENEGTVCILSGGQGKDEEHTEASVMLEYMEEKGIDRTRLITEEKSLSTNENLIFSLEIIGDPEKSTGIVTNNYHVARSVLTAKRLGYKDPAGIAAKAPVAFIPHNMMKEFLSLIKLFLFG